MAKVCVDVAVAKYSYSWLFLLGDEVINLHITIARYCPATSYIWIAIPL